MITALLGLTSCATLEKRIVPAYQHACEQEESVACDDATIRVAKYVDEADNAALQQKKLWQKQTLDFIAVLHAELETASCYHDSMIGSRAVTNTRDYYTNTADYSTGGISNAHFPQNVEALCSDNVKPIDYNDNGTKSSFIGAKTGRKIQCTGERQAIPDCQYKDKDVSFFLDRSNFTSSPSFCSSIEEDFVFSFADIEYTYHWQNKTGKITTTELRFASSSWHYTLLCDALTTGEMFCAAEAKTEHYRHTLSTNSLDCPALLGLFSDDWIPHKEIVTALSETELQKMRTLVRENNEQQETQQVAQRKIPVVQEDQPGYFLTSQVLVFAGQSADIPYRDKPTFPGVENIESILTPFAQENIFYTYAFDAKTKYFSTAVTLVGYTEQQTDVIREQLNILVILFMSELTASGKSMVKITLGDQQLDHIPATASFGVSYPMSTKMMTEHTAAQQNPYRIICPESIAADNASFAVFQRDLLGYKLECVMEKDNAPALWGVASFVWNQWQHQPFAVETMDNGQYASFTKGEYQLKHAACHNGTTWTAYENGSASVQTFSSQSLGKEFSGEALNKKTAEKFCEER
ncbi:hypothetical protein HZC31_03920 [Candidatus Woesearchaeota archaeon]|nr:hypothetical protein [Candidatus Woesearchaeota archaeon]